MLQGANRGAQLLVQQFKESSSAEPTGLWSILCVAGLAQQGRREGAALLWALPALSSSCHSGLCADGPGDMASVGLCLAKDQHKSLGSWDLFAWVSAFQRLVVTPECVFLIHRKCSCFRGRSSLGVACSQSTWRSCELKLCPQVHFGLVPQNFYRQRCSLFWTSGIMRFLFYSSVVELYTHQAEPYDETTNYAKAKCVFFQEVYSPFCQLFLLLGPVIQASPCVVIRGSSCFNCSNTWIAVLLW